MKVEPFPPHKRDRLVPDGLSAEPVLRFNEGDVAVDHAHEDVCIRHEYLPHRLVHLVRSVDGRRAVVHFGIESLTEVDLGRQHSHLSDHFVCRQHLHVCASDEAYHERNPEQGYIPEDRVFSFH